MRTKLIKLYTDDNKKLEVREIIYSKKEQAEMLKKEKDAELENKNRAIGAEEEIVCEVCGSLIGYGDGDLNCCYFSCPKCHCG